MLMLKPCTVVDPNPDSLVCSCRSNSWFCCKQKRFYFPGLLLILISSVFVGLNSFSQWHSVTQSTHHHHIKDVTGSRTFPRPLQTLFMSFTYAQGDSMKSTGPHWWTCSSGILWHWRPPSWSLLFGQRHVRSGQLQVILFLVAPRSKYWSCWWVTDLQSSACLLLQTVLGDSKQTWCYTLIKPQLLCYQHSK